MIFYQTDSGPPELEKGLFYRQETITTLEQQMETLQQDSELVNILKQELIEPKASRDAIRRKADAAETVLKDILARLSGE